MPKNARSHKQLALRIGACILSLSASAQGAEDSENSQPSALPNLELLEFLGQFETDQGEWIAPNEFLIEEFETLLDAAVSEDSEPSPDADNN